MLTIIFLKVINLMALCNSLAFIASECFGNTEERFVKLESCLLIWIIFKMPQSFSMQHIHTLDTAKNI